MSDSDEKDRKVIFVGGTAFSGSTLLDMMLANDPQGFSCGEVHALFRPYRPHHFGAECGCGDETCNLWGQIKKTGERHLYRAIFERFPGVRVIVDSSKNPFWIRTQSARLAHDGIGSRHVLIWKSPAEIRMSYRKRGREDHWLRCWVNYHRLYFSLVPTYGSLPYSVLTCDPGSLKATCRYLGIDYFPGKHDYWRKRHHTLFGNTSAKIHTRALHSDKYESDLTSLVDGTNGQRSAVERDFRTIYYHCPDSDEMAWTSLSRRRRIMLAGITQQLKAHDVRIAGTAVICDRAQPCQEDFDSVDILLRRIRDGIRGMRLRQSHHLAALLRL